MRPWLSLVFCVSPALTRPQKKWSHLARTRLLSSTSLFMLFPVPSLVQTSHSINTPQQHSPRLSRTVRPTQPPWSHYLFIAVWTLAVGAAHASCQILCGREPFAGRHRRAAHFPLHLLRPPLYPLLGRDLAVALQQSYRDAHSSSVPRWPGAASTRPAFWRFGSERVHAHSPATWKEILD